MRNDLKQAMDFLRGTLPQSDLDCYGESLLLQFVEHGMMLRRTAPWCRELDEELFAHYVLCPRINDEDLSFYSKTFFDALWERVLPLETMEQRILEVNRWCGLHANYQMQDDRTASPLTVYRNGSGRCGEESVFLVAALRSVGIPARQVYVPRWAHCDDNHAWVEAWCDGQWCFLGACEPEPVLDRGWFNTPASRALLVHSRLFGSSKNDVHGVFLEEAQGVSWYNQTARYALTQVYRFCVRRQGEPAVGAKIHIQVLNESSFHTVAVLTADRQGYAAIEMGRGDFYILAIQDQWRAEAMCHGAETVLQLNPEGVTENQWTTIDVAAPQSSGMNDCALNEAHKQIRAADREQGTASRIRREDAYQAAAEENPQWADLLTQARGNRQTVAQILKEAPAAEQLLRTLTPKDLRDVDLQTLRDHLRFCPKGAEIPEDIYWKYVACPRINVERLRPWRQGLTNALTGEQIAVFQQEPAALWDYLSRKMDTDGRKNYANLFWTPLESRQAGRCDEKSLKLLYVAMLRSMGIPARLRPLDGAVEYWKDGEFHTAQPEQTGELHLQGAAALQYRQEFTLSRKTADGWQLLQLPTDAEDLCLAEGVYRLICTRGMPNGNQRAAMMDVTVVAGKRTCAELRLPGYELAEMLGNQPLPPMSGVTLTGEQTSVWTEEPCLLLWLEEGAEPTEHLLLELDAPERLPLPVTVLLRRKESLQNKTLAAFLRSGKQVRVLLDDWHYDLEQVARCLTCDPDTPPLAVVCDRQGRAVFGASGYRVGLGKLLADIGAYIRK